MESNDSTEYTVLLEGPAPFLDVVFETISAYRQRATDLEPTEREYAGIVTGIDAVDAGDVDEEETAVVHLYVSGDVPPEEAREEIDLALSRIADEHNMTLARENLQLTFEPDEEAQ